MLNVAMFYDKHLLNDCTKFLKECIQNGETRLVRLRTNEVVKIDYYSKDRFQSIDKTLKWNLDGSNIDHSKYDIIEVLLNNGNTNERKF